MSATPYLKNAWAKKDANADYWLFIRGGDLEAMFRLHSDDEQDSIPRRALDAWLAEQDSTNGKTNHGIRPNNFLRTL